MIGKIFKDMIISKLFRLGRHVLVDWGLSKTKMEELLFMSRSIIRQFTKVVAAVQLTEHENVHLVSVFQSLSLCPIVTSCHDKSFKVSFGKKIGNLTEIVFVAVHCTPLLGSPTKVTSSKVRQGSWQYAY